MHTFNLFFNQINAQIKSTRLVVIIEKPANNFVPFTKAQL